MKKIFFLLLLIQGISAFGQVPGNDATWVLKKQDDFNSFDGTYWKSGWWWDPHWQGGVDSTYDDFANLIYTGGWLKMKIDSLTTPISYAGKSFKYKGASICADTSKYRYGYFEINAKLPLGWGFSDAFWVWSGSGNDTIHPCDTTWYNEIDIIEETALEAQYTDSVNNHRHWWDTTHCRLDWGAPPDPKIKISTADTNAHKYAVKWTPDHIIYYIDDSPVRTIYDPIYTPNHRLPVILDIAVDPWHGPNRYHNTKFPNYLQVDYLKIWQQAKACSTVETFCGTAFNSGTYNYAVKKSISIGGSGCTASTINTSSGVALWATDFIILGAGTTINSNGSGYFSADITICPN